MKRTLLALPLLLGACAADGTPVTTPVSSTVLAPKPTTGEIVMVEAIAPVSQRGGNAALQIGSSILGAIIPGPWGGVAGVASGQVGGIAMDNAQSRSARYHVRLTDGTIETFTQPTALTLVVGTPVDVLTLADGSRQIVQSSLPRNPATLQPITSSI